MAEERKRKMEKEITAKFEQQVESVVDKEMERRLGEERASLQKYSDELGEWARAERRRIAEYGEEAANLAFQRKMAEFKTRVSFVVDGLCDNVKKEGDAAKAQMGRAAEQMSQRPDLTPAEVGPPTATGTSRGCSQNGTNHSSSRWGKFGWETKTVRGGTTQGQGGRETWEETEKLTS